MARVGWVGAEVVGVEPETWYRLSVFDDGWVEVPGNARRAAYIRSDLPRAVRMLVVMVGLFGLAILVPRVGLPESLWVPLTVVLGLAALVGVIVLCVGELRRAVARGSLIRADVAQLRRERAEGRAVRRVPGAPLFRVARSATELASAITPVRIIRCEDVAAVVLGTEGENYVVTVRLVDGTERTYRSPDPALANHLRRFGSVIDARRPA